MDIRRRTLTGTPLLVATVGAAISLVGCEGIATTSGNLVAPPSYELCVTVQVKLPGMASKSTKPSPTKFHTWFAPSTTTA